MALRPLFLPPRLLFLPRRAGHAPCRERPALQRPLRGAAPGGAHPSVLGAGQTDGPRCAERGCSAFDSCGASLRAGFAAGTPVWEADGSRGFVGGNVSPNTASATTSLVLQSGRFCNMVNYHHGSPLCKERLAAEEVGCERSHNRCCEKWHSSHRKPLKMLHGPRARAPTPPWCRHPYRRVCRRGHANLALQQLDWHGEG